MTRTRFGSLVERIDIKAGKTGSSLPLLSVSQTLGVLRFSDLHDRPPRADSFDVYKVVEPGDIAFNKMSIRSGAVGVVPERGIVTYHYEVMRPRAGVDARFVVALMKSPWFISELIRNERGIGAGGAAGVRTTEVPFSVMRTIRILQFSVEEQRAIADYLDRETAEIDALRLETESLIHLAQDRGNALSEKLVWGCGAPVVRLKFIADILSGYPFKSENFLDLAEDTIPLLRGINVSPQGVVWDSVVSLSSSHSHQFSDYILKPGDLVLGLDRPLISSGLRLAEVEASDAGSLLVQRVARIRSKDPSTSNKWLKSALRSSRFRAHLEPDFTGVSVPHMSPGQLSEFAVPIPPLEVQSEILAEVNAENDAVSASVVDLQLLLNLLEERQSALISAAVTGQIDVAAQGASVAEQLRDELEVHV